MRKEKRLFYCLMIIALLGISIISGFNLVAIKGANVLLKDSLKADEPLKVVASISIVADFATQIGEGLFSVESIVSGTENPHIYEPTPSEIQMVAEADLFVRMGLEGLEPWVQSVLDSNPQVEVLELVEPTMIEYDPIIEMNNPHVWLDPNNAKTMVEAIYQAISERDPTNKLPYLSNRNNYLGELDALLARITQAKNEFQGTKVVVHHPAFKYFFDLLGIIRVAAIEEQEGVEPSAEHIEEIIEKIESENVTLIVNQPQLEEEEIIEIARETGTKIVELTPLLGVLDFEGKLIADYLSMMDYNLEALRTPHDPPKVGLNWTWWLLNGLGGGAIVAVIVVVIVIRIKNPRE